jgi:hypothetical protein
MIAGWIQQLGWRKPPAGHENTAVRSSVQETPHAAPVAQAAPEAVTTIAAVRQTVEQNLAAVGESLEQLAARQDQMEREITKLQADMGGCKIAERALWNIRPMSAYPGSVHGCAACSDRSAPALDLARDEFREVFRTSSFRRRYLFAN